MLQQQPTPVWKIDPFFGSLCGCKCLQACTTTLNQFSVMGGGGEGGGRAVDNGW